MSIESKIPKGEVNIKDLSIESQGDPTDVEFDVNKEVSEKDWENLKSALSERINSGTEPYAIAFFAANMKLLYPERMSDFRFGDIFLNRLQDFIKKARTEDNYHGISNATYWMKILYPKQPTQSILDKTTRGLLLEEMAIQRDNHRVQFAMMAANLKILDKDLVKSLNLNNTDYENMVDAYHQFKKADAIYNGIPVMAHAKILFPELVAKESVLKKDWKAILSSLRDDKHRAYTENDLWGNYLGTAVDLKMLAANEIRTTDEGVIFDMPEISNRARTESKLPQTKKF